LNPALSDFKYPMDLGKGVGFGFGIRHIPSANVQNINTVHQLWMIQTAAE